jgi:hypothetical protein
MRARDGEKAAGAKGDNPKKKKMRLKAPPVPIGINLIGQAVIGC